MPSLPKPPEGMVVYDHQGQTLYIHAEQPHRHADECIVQEVQREYFWSQLPAIKTAIDLGAHIGSWSHYCKLIYPEARITAVEADPDTYQITLKNLSGLEGVMTRNARVGYAPGKHYVYQDPRNSGSNFVFSEGEMGRVKAYGAIKITKAPEPLTLEEIIILSGFETQIDVLKTDIEGTEVEVINQADGWALRRFNHIVGEIHTTPERFQYQTNNRLHKLGFVCEYYVNPGDPGLGYLHAYQVL